MTWWRRLLRRGALEAELDAELRDHVERLVADHIAAGLSPSEARRRAALAFGGVESIREACRDVRGTRWLEDAGADVRYALRLLGKSPAFGVVALVSLALGIGANIVVACLVDAVILRTLPVAAPEALVVFAERLPDREVLSWSRAQVRDLGSSDALAGFCAFRPRIDFTIAGPSGVDLVPGQMVSGNCFDVIGVHAALGRTLTPEDENAGEARPAAVIGHGFWQRYFGGDPAVIGRTLQIKGRAFTVVGVTPRAFFGFEQGRTVDVTIPLSLQPLVLASPMLASPNVRWLRLIGRLRPGVSAGQAAAALDHRRDAQGAAPAAGAPRARLELRPGAQGLSDLRQQFLVPLRILMAAVALLLLVACANLASLMLARARTRDHEIRLRLALGARRGRLVRQLFTESLLLSAAGGLAGLALASWGTRAIVALLSRGRAPIFVQAEVDARLVAFTFGVSVVTGIAVGMWPALWATRRAAHSPLQGTARTVAAGGRLRTALLIGAQTTVSAVLLMGTVLFVRTLANLRAVDVGFDKAHVLVVSVGPGLDTSNRVRMNRDLYARLSGAPGLHSVTTTMDVPLGGGGSYTAGIAVPPGTPGDSDQVSYNFVGPRFFETLRIPILAGRDISVSDDDRSRPVAVVSASLAARYFAGRSAVGGHLQAGPQVVEIVGVAADVPYTGLRAEKERVLYRPYFQNPAGVGQTFALRTDLPPAAGVDLVRSALRDVSPGVAVGSVVALEAQVDAAMASERLLAIISFFFGVMAMLLVGIGIYGTLVYSIAQRTRELGIRIALGASRRNIMGLILGGALTPVCLGLAAGVPLALAASQVTRGILFGIGPREPAAYGTVMAVLLTAAVLAAALPARRAVRADPIAALRES